MNRLELKSAQRQRRKLRIRSKLFGTAERPRMTVFKSNKHTYVQVVDDSTGRTIAAASNLEKDLRNLKNTAGDAEKIGLAIGERLKKANVSTVIFDRNGYLFHGVVKAVADGARKAGIEF